MKPRTQTKIRLSELLTVETIDLAGHTWATKNNIFAHLKNGVKQKVSCFKSLNPNSCEYQEMKAEILFNHRILLFDFKLRCLECAVKAIELALLLQHFQRALYVVRCPKTAGTAMMHVDLACNAVSKMRIHT